MAVTFPTYRTGIQLQALFATLLEITNDCNTLQRHLFLWIVDVIVHSYFTTWSIIHKRYKSLNIRIYACA